MAIPCSQHQRCAVQFQLGCDPARPGPWHASSWQPAVCSASPSCPAAAAAPVFAFPSMPAPQTHTLRQERREQVYAGRLIWEALDRPWRPRYALSSHRLIVLPLAALCCQQARPAVLKREFRVLLGRWLMRRVNVQESSFGYAKGHHHLCQLAVQQVSKRSAGCAKGH